LESLRLATGKEASEEVSKANKAAYREASIEAGDLLFRLTIEFGPMETPARAEMPGLLAEGRPDGLVELSYAERGRPKAFWRILTGANELITGLVFSTDGTRLAARTAGSQVRIWDLGTGQEITAGAAARTPFSPAEIGELCRRAREMIGQAEVAVPSEAPPAEEPEYLPFSAHELMEKSHADASRE
jgi:WD40 repeat protein